MKKFSYNYKKIESPINKKQKLNNKIFISLYVNNTRKKRT